MGKIFIEGNQAVAMGALYTGCKFFAAYPITPASTLLSAILEILPATGGFASFAKNAVAFTGKGNTQCSRRDGTGFGGGNEPGPIYP